MAGSTSNLDLISSSQASKEVTANALFDAGSTATLYGRRASTTTALTWGFYGGMLDIAGTITAIINGTIALTASNTNYVVASRATGAVSVSTATTNWNDSTGYIRLYSIVAGASTITSYTDYRTTSQTQTVTAHITDATDAHAASAITNTPAGNIAATTIQAAINELDTEKEAVANKATSFGTVNDTLYPTVQAVKTYADALVVGLLDDRGNYDASVNTFPASGGSGTAGAILKGDVWYISVAGTLDIVPVIVGDTVRALTDAPGQTASNWSIMANANEQIGSNIHAATEKTTPVDADEFAISDSAASFVLKRLTWANIKATLGSTFAALAGSATQDFATKALATAGNATLGDSAIFDAHTINGKATVNDIRLAAVSATLPTLTFVDSCFHLAKDDTDGGAWRKRKGQSWRSEARSAGKYLGVYSTATTAVAAGGALTDVYYNTTNLRFEEITNVGTPASTVTYRAGREDYPTNALITAEAARVIIWDLDRAVPSMWGSYALSNVSCIVAKDGLVILGMAPGGAYNYDFASDKLTARSNSSHILVADKLGTTAVHTNTWSQSSFLSTNYLVNNTVNDVAITVLDNAPIDPATGLPVPTIAVATAGGVSIIKDSGTVVNSSSTASISHARFNSRNELACRDATAGRLFVYSSYLSAGFPTSRLYSSVTVPALPEAITHALASGNIIAAGSATRLSLIHENPTTQASSMIAAITSAYNSGIMCGDIRRAWLADNLSGTITDTELVTNGTFDTDITGWTAGNGATLTLDTNRLLITGGVGGNGYAYQAVTTVSGKTYNVSATFAQGTTPLGLIYIGTSVGGNQLGSTTFTTDGVKSVPFTATGTTTYVRVGTNTTTDGLSCYFDNISVKEVSADRSIKNKPLSVTGTLTRTAYTGGRTVYSGFSAANYFQEPSHADWNALGTGDFSIVMSGVKWGTVATLKTLISMGDGASNGSVKVEHLAANTLRVSIYNAGWTTICTSTATFTDTAEHVVEFKRYTQAGVASTVAIVVDGVVIASAVSVLTISNATGYLRVGEGQDASQPWVGGFCSCARISATAPTAEQSRYIALSENALNGGNACLLSNSNSVSALSYDKDTNSLFVGNGTNLDTFIGFRNIASQAHGVTTLTSVASINGRKLIAGTGASYTAPERNISAELLEAQTTKPRTQNYSFTSSGTTQALPQGWKAQGVLFNLTDGTMSSASQTFDGFLWTLASLTTAKAYQIQLVEA